MTRVFTAAAAALCLTAGAHAQDADAPTDAVQDAVSATAAAPIAGPVVGAPAPDLSLPDATGATRTLADLSGEQGVAVVFVRAAAWCPVCQAQMIDLNDHVERFAEQGFTLVAVTTDTVEEIATFTEVREIEYPLLADTDSAVIKAWNIIDPAHAEPRTRGRLKHNGLPFPSTFIVTQDGLVADALFDETGYGQRRGYKDRVLPDDILAAAIAAVPAPDMASDMAADDPAPALDAAADASAPALDDAAE